ncbi:hypothetical protein PENTCL1PPCAC_24240, partial [Pristionchus entomophagus]
ARERQTIFQRMNQLIARSPHLKTLVFNCLACEAKLSGSGIIAHFIGTKHQAKVTDLGAAVSRAAVEYWLDKLQPAAQPPEAAPTGAADSNASWTERGDIKEDE